MQQRAMATHLSFHGAAGTVTGSCYLLEHGGSRILIDCGMFQGSKTLKQLNYDEFPFEPGSLDAVLVTHAHIDHTGLLPKLMLAGYAGSMIATAPTVALLGAMLPDSGHIQEMDVENLNRRNIRRGQPEVSPIYTKEDAIRCLEQLKPVEFDQWIDVAPGLRARWWNAGHLLGSGSIEIEIDQGGQPLRLLFSGDIGPNLKLLQEPPEGPVDCDIIIVEATYGDRDRQDITTERRRDLLAREVSAAAAAGGPLIIPSFAVERTQEVVTDLVNLMETGRVPKATIFVDSPLAKKATEIFREHADALEDPETLRHAFGSPQLLLTESVEESKAIARFKGFHIIIAASGMCEAGRIRHHLKNWLPKRQACVLLVGYQGAGTLGRQLEQGEKIVRIQGEEVAVRARIAKIESYSGHADGPELLAWLKQRGKIGDAIFMTHGEENGRSGLRARILDAGLLADDRIIAPQMDQGFVLIPGGVHAIHDKPGRRIPQEEVARPDWNQEHARLLADLGSVLEKKADNRSREIVLRRLRRALEETGDLD
jgi:metallo-beta-lactamase family protein